MATKHIITWSELVKLNENGIDTFSKKDNSPRGMATVCFSELSIGDCIVLDNFFTEIVNDEPEATPTPEATPSEAPTPTPTPKKRATEKFLRQNYPVIISVPYCTLQTLLSYETPKYYTCGIYGWKADFYEFYSDLYGTVLVSTGYQPIGVSIDKITIEYEKSAIEFLEIIRSHKNYSKLSYNDLQALFQPLIDSYILKVKEKLSILQK